MQIIIKESSPRFYLEPKDNALIREWLFKNGYTLKSFCSKLNISATNFSNILAGKTAIGRTLLFKVVNETQIDLFELQTGEKLKKDGKIVVEN